MTAEKSNEEKKEKGLSLQFPLEKGIGGRSEREKIKRLKGNSL